MRNMTALKGYDPTMRKWTASEQKREKERLETLKKSEPLWNAIRSNDPTLLDRSLSQGADLEARNDSGETALHIAVSAHQPDMINTLLAKGANIEALDDYNRTPLYRAVNLAIESAALKKEAAYQVVEALLDKGADKNAKRDSGDTVMEMMKQSGDTRLTRIFDASSLWADTVKEPGKPRYLM